MYIVNQSYHKTSTIPVNPAL